MEYRAFQCVLSSCGWMRTCVKRHAHTIISTHSTLTDGDQIDQFVVQIKEWFQSTPPLRAETADFFNRLFLVLISIRAIHKGQRPFYFAIRSSLICEVLSRVTTSKAVTLALISSTFSATWSSFWNFSFMPC